MLVTNPSSIPDFFLKIIMLNVLDRCETLNLNVPIELILLVEIASFHIWILFRFFSVLNLIKLFLFNHIKTIDLKKAIHNRCVLCSGTCTFQWVFF